MAAVPFGCAQVPQVLPGVLPVPSILSVLIAGGGQVGRGLAATTGGPAAPVPRAVPGRHGLLAPGRGRYSVTAKGCPGGGGEVVTIVDNAVYVDGHRTADPESLDETYFILRQRQGMAWIGLYRPDADELRSVAEEFDLNHLAVDDALAGHQRAKLEHYGETLFLVLRPARYLDELEQVEFGEIHVFAGDDFVVTVRRAESPDLARVRRRMESEPEFLALGPAAVLYAILDQVVDEYEPVAAGLENDVDEIEDDLFAADPGVSRRIYELSRQVIMFQRATAPLVMILQSLMVEAPDHQPRRVAGPLPGRPGPCAAAQRARRGLPCAVAECARGQCGARGPAAER